MHLFSYRVNLTVEAVSCSAAFAYCLSSLRGGSTSRSTAPRWLFCSWKYIGGRSSSSYSLNHKPRSVTVCVSSFFSNAQVESDPALNPEDPRKSTRPGSFARQIDNVALLLDGILGENGDAGRERQCNLQRQKRLAGFRLRHKRDVLAVRQQAFDQISRNLHLAEIGDPQELDAGVRLPPKYIFLALRRRLLCRPTVLRL